MPAFSPTIGKFGDVTPRGKPWMLWYKRHSKRLFWAITGLAVITLLGGGWWYWYGRNIPAPGGTLDEGIIGYPQRLNPLFSQQNEVEAELVPLLFRGLLRYNQANELVPDLADKVEISEDGKKYAISIGHHKWHDGTLVSAKDVAYTINTTQNKDYQGPLSGYFADVAIEVQDPNHLTLTLKEPYAPFEQNLTIGILPEHILGGTAVEDLATDQFNFNPVGTGKLKFQSMQRNPDTGQINQLQLTLTSGYIDKVNYHFYDSLQSAMTDFKLGKIHTLWSQYDPRLNTLASFDKQEKYTTLEGQTYGLFFNTQSPNASDAKVRQALALVIPKQEILQKVFHNHAVSADNVYGKSSWAYSDQLETYSYNADSAKEKWEAVESKPKSITLLIPELQIHESIAKEIKRNWEKLGVRVDIKSENGNKVGEYVDSGAGYDVVLLGEKVNRDPDRYSNWHSTQTPPSGLNISRIKNDRVDKALEDGRRLLDREERKAKYATFQDYLSRDAAVIWLYRPQFVYMWSNKLHGVKIGNTWNEQDRFAELENWYINLAKR